jgi:hypothetical protein
MRELAEAEAVMTADHLGVGLAKALAQWTSKCAVDVRTSHVMRSRSSECRRL